MSGRSAKGTGAGPRALRILEERQAAAEALNTEARTRALQLCEKALQLAKADNTVPPEDLEVFEDLEGCTDDGAEMFSTDPEFFIATERCILEASSMSALQLCVDP